jgi:hypothetical protein
MNGTALGSPFVSLTVRVRDWRNSPPEFMVLCSCANLRAAWLATQHGPFRGACLLLVQPGGRRRRDIPHSAAVGLRGQGCNYFSPLFGRHSSGFLNTVLTTSVEDGQFKRHQKTSSGRIGGCYVTSMKLEGPFGDGKA